MSGTPSTRKRFPFPESITFDETDKTVNVRGWCSVCVARGEVYGCGVVSPSGLMHIGMQGGDTKCGKDATGDDWWWLLGPIVEVDRDGDPDAEQAAREGEDMSAAVSAES